MFDENGGASGRGILGGGGWRRTDFLITLLAPTFVLVQQSDELQLALLMLTDEPLLLQHSQITANATRTITRMTITAKTTFGVADSGATSLPKKFV